MITRIGLDLGYANFTISTLASQINREPSVVLIDKKMRNVLAVGNAAGGDNPPSDEKKMPVRPFKNGLLYSSDLTAAVLKYAIEKLGKTDKIRALIALPSDFVPKQEAEMFHMLSEAGVHECISVNPALAALVGAGYAPTASAISVNIGASATEIAVLHKGKIIVKARKNVGGEAFDKAIKQYIQDQGDMTVSLLVARMIKERLGAVWQGRPTECLDIEGTLSLTGNRVKMTICTEDVVGVFEKPLQELLLAVAETVKKIPIDCVEDIFENGIILSGGGAEIFGLDTMMTKVYGIKTVLAQSPIDAVAKGLSRIHTFIPSRLPKGQKNITDHLAKYFAAKKKSKKSSGGNKDEEE